MGNGARGRGDGRATVKSASRAARARFSYLLRRRTAKRSPLGAAGAEIPGTHFSRYHPRLEDPTFRDDDINPAAAPFRARDGNHPHPKPHDELGGEVCWARIAAASIVATVKEALDDPHFAARGTFALQSEKRGARMEKSCTVTAGLCRYPLRPASAPHLRKFWSRRNWACTIRSICRESGLGARDRSV